MMSAMDHKTSPAVCLTQIGQRTNHEDNFLFQGHYLTPALQTRMADRRPRLLQGIPTGRIQLFAISDGMGGHNAGEVASRLCMDQLAKSEKELEQCVSIHEVVARLQFEIAELNHTICTLSHHLPDCKGMGTTLVLLAICGSECAVLNIGDSRAYHFQGHTLRQITRDHTEGQRMLDLGLLSRKELVDFPARKNLNRYIGYDAPGYVLQAEVFYPTLQEGVLVLCSDGISDVLSEITMTEILAQTEDLVQAGKQCMEYASAHGSDNATILLIPIGR